MKHLKYFSINESVADKYATYSFDKKIVKNKANVKNNALNIKEVIHISCNWCLDQSCKIFMFEIAIVETGLATHAKSNATSGDIGRSLFHIDEGTFVWTKISHPRINKALESLKKHGLDWNEVTWTDISENILLGAIACKLVLLKKGFNNGTDNQLYDIKNRALLYAKKYNGGGTKEAAENYIRNVKGWCITLKEKGAEYLTFGNIKYNVTENGLVKNV